MLNDFDLNIEFSSASSFIFIIYYKKESNKYYLRTFKDKQIPGQWLLMIKIEKDFVLSKKEIFSISDYFFQIITTNDKIEIKKLAIKNKQDSEYYYIIQNL
jgi:hypothetical protein